MFFTSETRGRNTSKKTSIAALALLAITTSNFATAPVDQGEVIIDGPNTLGGSVDIGFSQSNGWTQSSFGGYNGGSLWTTTWGEGDAVEMEVWKNTVPNAQNLQTATWEITPYLEEARSKRVEVYATWTHGSNRATDAKYRIFHDFGIDTVTVDQTQSANGWYLLGTYEFYVNSGYTPEDPVNQVRLFNDFENGTVVSADAIKFNILPDEIIADNGDDSFSASGNWFVGSSTPGYYGNDYHVRATGSVSDAAQWDVSLSDGGQWEVFARWSAGANRASAAPYIINYANGTSTVYANQQQNGGDWVSLGTYTFNQGPNSVNLSCWTSSGTFVIADSVRFLKK